MDQQSSRWNTISESPHQHEREALAFIRERLPDHDPYSAWANFEFIAEGGQIYEVDLLVMTPKGVFMVEIKNWEGVISGDANNWVVRGAGAERREESPLILDNRKAKCLKSLLSRTKAFKGNGPRCPWIEPLVFLSHPGVTLDLDPHARQGIHLRDIEAGPGREERPGIIHALKAIPRSAYASGTGRRIDRRIGTALLRAMNETGIRKVKRQRKVRDYVLGDLIFEGPGYQDFAGSHVSLPKTHRRVRIYSVAQPGAGPPADTVKRAARREFEVLSGVDHQGVLKALDYIDTEFGPALLFEHDLDPAPLRLDYYLAREGDRLGVEQRLSILRQLAEALLYAHSKKLVHRALSPESVLVRNPKSREPRVEIFNWQTAAREIGSASSSGAMTCTRHLDDLVSKNARVYMAPEAFSDPEASGETLDVFSLGALAYHVFANRPPASDHLKLFEILREAGGLELSAEVDGACESLRSLVHTATTPRVLARPGSMREFLVSLDAVEEELTAPDEDAVADPQSAGPKDTLQGGFRVIRRLGSGSTAIVYLVERSEVVRVLKIARSPDHDERIRQEAEVLETLAQTPHLLVVRLEERVEVSGRQAMLLTSAGDTTLSDRIRKEGRLSTDLLQRFGEDLLDIVHFLEGQGIPHRDLKPDNLGVTKVGKDKSLRLILFDFSLSRAPAEQIRAGTRGYTDPFLALRPKKRWDVQAEHFSAAVTLYEMASGKLPVWGDGRTDPAFVEEEATLEPELFDAAIRRSLNRFFEKALRRDVAERFDNIDEMRREWRRAFEEPGREPDEEPGEVDDVLREASLTTPVVTLPLTTRAQNVLERESIFKVRDLLSYPASRFASLWGVGQKTRNELLNAVRVLGAKFPEDARDAGEEPEEETPKTIEALADLLVSRRLRGLKTTEALAVQGILGLDHAEQDVTWVSQAELAGRFDVTRARIGQCVTKARERWRRLPQVTLLRDEINFHLEAAGGILTLDELAANLVAVRGTGAGEAEAHRSARAAIRAATEVEGLLESERWSAHREEDAVYLTLLSSGGGALVRYARSLGKMADELAEEDPLASPDEAEAKLRRVEPPKELVPLSHERLIHLAAVSSERAVVSPRLELYPRGLSADRAVRLARGALLGVPELTVEQVRARVRSRYPAAADLPPRPALDGLLTGAGLDLAFADDAADGKGGYRRITVEKADVSSGRTSLHRFRTRIEPVKEVPPEVADARQFEEKLLRARKEGAFLVLCVTPDQLPRAEEELRHERFDLDPLRLDASFLSALRGVCERRQVAWENVIGADSEGPRGEHWSRVLRLVGEAVREIEAGILSREGTLLLTDPGLLARFEQMGFLETLRDAVGARTRTSEVTLGGAWLLLGVTDQNELPTIDGRPVPVLARSHWSRIPEPWLRNRHRAGIAGSRPALAGKENGN